MNSTKNSNEYSNKNYLKAIIGILVSVPILSILCVLLLPGLNDQIKYSTQPVNKLPQKVVVFSAKDGTELARINVEIAQTDTTRSQGLMFRNNLNDNAGMLFIFDREALLSFWMKNTYIPLDIIFISSDRNINTIHIDTVPMDSNITYDSSKPSLYTIEVNAGFTKTNQIRVGDKITIE